MTYSDLTSAIRTRDLNGALDVMAAAERADDWQLRADAAATVISAAWEAPIGKAPKARDMGATVPSRRTYRDSRS